MRLSQTEFKRRKSQETILILQNIFYCYLTGRCSHSFPSSRIAEMRISCDKTYREVGSVLVSFMYLLRIPSTQIIQQMQLHISVPLVGQVGYKDSQGMYFNHRHGPLRVCLFLGHRFHFCPLFNRSLLPETSQLFNLGRNCFAFFHLSPFVIAIYVEQHWQDVETRRASLCNEAVHQCFLHLRLKMFRGDFTILPPTSAYSLRNFWVSTSFKTLPEIHPTIIPLFLSPG